MGSKLKGSKTEKNLLTAFAGASQARNRYDYFASQARKDGYVQISKIFQETALNEGHAKRLQVPPRKGGRDSRSLPVGGHRGHRRQPQGLGHGVEP
jgi:rubrerythrin